MVALYDYDPTENSPNVDGDVSQFIISSNFRTDNIFNIIYIIILTKH